MLFNEHFDRLVDVTAIQKSRVNYLSRLYPSGNALFLIIFLNYSFLLLLDFYVFLTLHFTYIRYTQFKFQQFQFFKYYSFYFLHFHFIYPNLF